MVKERIDKNKLKRPSKGMKPSPDSQIREVDEVIIQVTQVFCPNGHNLVRPHEDLFDGAPGINLLVSDGRRQGTVILSPYHGDHRRRGEIDFPEGSRLQVLCPECHELLPELGPCTCHWQGRLFKLYLTPALSDNQVVALCDVWGCHRSTVFDQAQVLSAFIES